MQQFIMAVTDLQARADIQTEGRAGPPTRSVYPVGPRFQGNDDGIPDAWVGLSHKEALVPPPGSSGPSGNPIRPVLSKSGNTDAQ